MCDGNRPQTGTGRFCFGKQRQVDFCEFKTSLGCTVKLRFKVSKEIEEPRAYAVLWAAVSRPLGLKARNVSPDCLFLVAEQF